MGIKDLTGKKFGVLIVKEAVRTGTHGREYLCLCECGNKKIIRGDSLTSGRTISCGCIKDRKIKERAANLHKYRDKRRHIKKAEQHVGEKFNYLEIISVEKNNMANVMVCICDCGNITKQIYADLKTGKVKSCGCSQREQASIMGSKIGANNYKNNYNWYFIKDEKKIKCRSGYEVIYANYLIDNNIEFEYEPECFKLDNGKRYTPDFYLINENKYVEIKGSFKMNNSNQKENSMLFSKTNNLTIMYWNDLINVCLLPFRTYSTYLRRAKKYNIKAEDFLANKLYII